MRRLPKRFFCADGFAEQLFSGSLSPDTVDRRTASIITAWLGESPSGIEPKRLVPRGRPGLRGRGGTDKVRYYQRLKIENMRLKKELERLRGCD